MEKPEETKTPCPLCQDPSGVGTYEKTEPSKSTYMGANVGTWLSRLYRLEGDELTLTVTAQYQSESDIYYDDDDDDTGMKRARMVMNFRVAFCPLCNRKIMKSKGDNNA